MEGAPEPVLRALRDGVGIISLNRPARHNAIDDALYDALLGAVEWATATAEVRAVLLRGEGRSFCSGRDTASMGAHSLGDSHFAHMRRTQLLASRIAECHKPVVAALHGHVLGKGLEIALAADVRLAAEHTVLALPEIDFALGTDNGGAARCRALIGPSRTKYLTMSGERVDADLALRWGLVDFVVAPNELDAAAFDLAGRLATKSPLALAVAKELVDHIDRPATELAMRIERYTQIALFSTDDHAEARASRRDGRSPRFPGR